MKKDVKQKQIYLSWIGENDFKFLDSIKGYDNGSIFAFLNSDYSNNIDEFYLLHSKGYKDDKFKKYIMKAKKYFNKYINVHDVVLSNPTDYGEIYTIVESFLDDNSYYHIQVSSGTSQMSAVWLLLSKTTLNKRSTIYQGYFDESKSKDNLYKVDIPFDIELEYLHKQKKEKDILYNWNKLPKYLDIRHKSEVMKNLLDLVWRVSKVDVPAILLGETGVGKELIAKAIHSSSNRSDNKMITVNCASLNNSTIEATLFGWSKGAWTGSFGAGEGLFLEANNSTIFLDEIGELSLDIQAKLLRVIEYGVINRVGDGEELKTDVRIISATNRDLIKMVKENKFRRDLFYRLNVAIIKIPPLRKRKEDIVHIAKYFLDLQNKKLKRIKEFNYIEKDFSIDAKRFLISFNWPGNIRELYHTIERATIWTTSSLITEKILKDNIISIDENHETITFPIDIKKKINEIEKKYIIEALKETNYSITKATKLLNYKNYQTLNNKIDKYKINIE